MRLSGVNAMLPAFEPTLMTPLTVLLAVSITVTLRSSALVAYAKAPFGLTSTATGYLPTTRYAGPPATAAGTDTPKAATASSPTAADLNRILVQPRMTHFPP
nr:hypothetical protein GCM10017745_74950 [Saccharothrix mutabilis subsp. capreolus]